jgi:phosphatidylserine/phosphatidylglycerophosphate/cardiolipin synthase-like enzyme
MRFLSLPLMLLCLPLILAAAPATTQPTTAPATQALIEAHFSPEEKIAPTIVKLIDSAQHSIDVAAFEFSHPDIAAALIRANDRGVQIGFVMDYRESRLSTCRAKELIDAGIDVLTRHQRGVQHNKYMIIDEQIVMTGSYNYSPSADERNSENLLVIRDSPEIAAEFVKDFELLHKDTTRTRGTRREGSTTAPTAAPTSAPVP